jgi:hypothetical protein
MNKKVIIILVLAALVFNCRPAPAQAQASFVLGMFAGAVLFGDGSTTGASSSTVLYTMTKVSDRIKSPLKVRLACFEVDFASYNNGRAEPGNCMSYEQLFQKAVKESGQFEILQILRVIRPDRVSVAAIWFAYIEKSEVSPLK